MFEYRDLSRWDRFITPTLVKPFFGVMIGFVVLMGLSGIFSGLSAMAINPFGGFIVVVASIVGIIAGIMFSRVVAEFVLIAFRINEHLGAIRDQGETRKKPPPSPPARTPAHVRQMMRNALVAIDAGLLAREQEPLVRHRG